MSTLYIDRKDLTLGLAGGRLRLRLDGVAVRDVPLALLDRVVIHARTTLDTGVLGALAENGTAVLVLSPRQGRRVAIVLGRPHNDLRVRLAQFQRVTDRDWCGAWSARLVAHKLGGQRRVLLAALERRPDQRRALLNGAERLERLGQAVRETRDPDTLRGLEGAGAAAYFEALASVFPPSLAFRGRNRRPPRDPVNACLSLTYTLLHFEAVGRPMGPAWTRTSAFSTARPSGASRWPPTCSNLCARTPIAGCGRCFATGHCASTTSSTTRARAC